MLKWDCFEHIQSLAIKTFLLRCVFVISTLGLDISDVHDSPHDTVSCSPADPINAGGVVKVLFVACHVPKQTHVASKPITSLPQHLPKGAIIPSGRIILPSFPMKS